MRLFVSALVMVFLVGCSGGQPGAPVPQPAPPVVESPLVPPATPESPPVESPAMPPAPPESPSVQALGSDLAVTGLERPWLRAWSPSGRRALLTGSPDRAFLLDTEAAGVSPLAGMAGLYSAEFWSERELLWMDRQGRLSVRDLQSGGDRLLHEFGSPVLGWFRPGDTHFVANRVKGMVQQGYQFGAIVAGQLGATGETELIESGHLIGRMVDGQVLAVEGHRGGPLWAFAPTGERRLLSRTPAYFVQLSPDGRRALWLTGPEAGAAGLAGLSGSGARAVGPTGPGPGATLLDWLRPAVAHADPPYLPRLSDLWLWDGGPGEPQRIPLGGTFSAQAESSPDGLRVALALNPPFDEVPRPATGPGTLAVIEEGRLRPLATSAELVSIGMWLGPDGFQFGRASAEKTGAQAPIMRIDLAGQETQFSQAIWWPVGRPGGEQLLLDWRGEDSVVCWRGEARPARVAFGPNDQVGEPQYVPPQALYMAFSGPAGLRLKPLER